MTQLNDSRLIELDFSDGLIFEADRLVDAIRNLTCVEVIKLNLFGMVEMFACAKLAILCYEQNRKINIIIRRDGCPPEYDDLFKEGLGPFLRIFVESKDNLIL